MAKTKKNENNFKIEVDGDILTMTVDLSEDLGESNSGRSIIVGRSGKFEKVPGFDDYAINCFVVKRKEKNGKK